MKPVLSEKDVFLPPDFGLSKSTELRFGIISFDGRDVDEEDDLDFSSWWRRDDSFLLDDDDELSFSFRLLLLLLSRFEPDGDEDEDDEWW
jgi:hypothetical protein